MTFAAREFRPARWARGPHTQTLAARVLRPADSRALHRERMTTPDDDFLDLDWGTDPGPGSPIVLVIHGLEGSARRRYMRNACRELERAGLWPVALNLRGCSGESNRALHFYHSGKTDDPAFVLDTIRERYPDRLVGALGFSLGGNVLLKLLGERGDGGMGLVDAAVAMSVPYDLAAGCALLERSTMGRAYATYFLRSLKSKVELKRDRLARVVDVEAGAAARTIWEFDDRVTAPLHGFQNAAAYYEACSSVRYLAGISTPTLLLHAMDDPFLPAEAVPRQQAERNPALHLALEARGGHVGFLEGTPWRPSFWGDEEAARFLEFRLLNVGKLA
ncbi:MAG TPA: alpha/beta fold hydrolase [Longimicrobiales bacterium]|nr:alpha/beta fold hydrolase [Longimicrobiales bacterium]